ncbi:MAG: hypothetical protein EOQ64_15560 [Mesorhizobium sp.]|uniref:hypothetical protein n=1 Tax=Mesorhizobium sp. TaxID=1871066 RepID=UPI000FE4832E|nr:hypothetical protein [Mesorhizobium sp.]RWG55880.1 MAG: hypothetical protein EOQ64_15560 [Mesorhizobium sp.]RWH44929.1 MAG: hypothetical protein EOQ78_08335 [Mesorhizobium sp.]
MSDIQELKRDQLLAEIGPDVVTAEMLAERVGICTPPYIATCANCVRLATRSFRGLASAT